MAARRTMGTRIVSDAMRLAQAAVLVAKQEQLIELPQEKRVALITRAVTKGRRRRP